MVACLLESGAKRHGEEKCCKKLLKEAEKVMRVCCYMVHFCINALELVLRMHVRLVCAIVYNSFYETVQV